MSLSSLESAFGGGNYLAGAFCRRRAGVSVPDS
jgi:hypothetical protein